MRGRAKCRVRDGRLPDSRLPAYRSPTYGNPGRYEPLSEGVRRANDVMLWRFCFDLVREFAPHKAGKSFRLRPYDVYDDG